MYTCFIILVLITLFVTAIGFVWYSTVLLDPLVTASSSQKEKPPKKDRPSAPPPLVTVPAPVKGPILAAFQCPYFVLVGYAISTIFVVVAVNKFHLSEKLIYLCCIGIVCFGWNITCALFVLNHIGAMEVMQNHRAFPFYDNVKQCLVSSSIVYFFFEFLLALVLIARKEHGCMQWYYQRDENACLQPQSSGSHHNEDEDAEHLHLLLDSRPQNYRTMSRRVDDAGSEDDSREVIFTGSTRRERVPEVKASTRDVKTPDAARRSRSAAKSGSGVFARAPKTPVGAPSNSNNTLKEQTEPKTPKAPAAAPSNKNSTANELAPPKTPESSNVNTGANKRKLQLESITPLNSMTSGEISYSSSPYGTSLQSFEEALSSTAAEAVARASRQYDAHYKRRMQNLSAPSMQSGARPFIGFSLTDNVRDGSLVVDGVFDAGPAAQVGVEIDDELLAVAGVPVRTILQVRDLIAANCHPGYVTPFTLRSAETGETYDADVWVMTTDAKYYGKSYFFNPKTHTVRQSDRLKQTWRSSADSGDEK